MTEPERPTTEGESPTADLEPDRAGGAGQGFRPTIGDAVLGFVAGLFGATVMVTVVAANLGGDAGLAITAAGLVGLWAGLLWGAYLASTRHGTGSIRRDFGLRITPGDLGLGLLGGLGVQAMVAIMYRPFADLESELSAPARSLTAQAPDRTAMIALTVMVVVGAPLVEELFFRGVLLGALRRLGTAVAVLVSAAAFALVHFNQLLAMPAFVVLGIVLGIFTVGQGRLGAAIATHATFNAITMAVLLAPAPA